MAQKIHKQEQKLDQRQRIEVEKYYSRIEQFAREAKYRQIGA